ncbi:hypothetical protein BsWGS_21358 [Bradybaena similaris]
MPRPPMPRMNDIVREDQKREQYNFLRDTEEFPCLFNIGNCKLDIGSRKYNGIAVCELDVSKNKLKSLQGDLNNDSEVSECDEVVWKDNLLTYVYAELGNFGDAFKLNRKIQDQHGKSNLVALVNAAFLFHKTGNLCEACRILDDLKTLTSQESFADLKINAIYELGYAFRKLAGPKNLQFSISFLEFALLVRPHEQIQLMLAIVYRRCCHFHIYSADPEKIIRHDFGLKAATSLFEIGTKSKNTSFKAAALIELAYLKYDDDVYALHHNNGKHSILSPEEWFQIVQDRTWKELCEEALEACEDGPSEKVLKIAGQLYRYYGKDDEFLEKSVQLLTRAIEKKPSSRAHHHLGLTYKKMATCHEQKDDMNQNYSQGPLGGNNVRTGRQYTPNGFANNTGEITHTNRGYYHQRIYGRQEHNIHRQNHETIVADGCARSNFHTKPMEFVNNKEMRHSNRGHHHQRLTSQSDYNKHTVLGNNTKGAEVGRLQMLPKPPVNNTPQKPEKSLKYIAKVPDQFKSFSKGNPYSDKAIHHLKQAVDISCYQNKGAVYDYACILVQADNYEKSKEICKNLINECTTSETLTFDPLYLVNAYNLYGICCAKEAEAEVNQANKERLANESEQHLTLAVRLASYLAATVPELEMCATDLWNAFTTLKTKFKFEGQKYSRDKLYRLCEYISDYRFLEAVDEIVSQDREELKKMEVIEQCLQRYLNMKAYDSALLFRDLIIFHPEMKTKLLKSKVYKQLMLEVVEGKLEKMYLEGNTEACHADPAWKQLFNDEFIATDNAKKYDIVIVSDFNDDCELKTGLMSDISEHLKRVLLETFGLNVVLAHEEGLPGRVYLEEQLLIINNSRVSIFVLTDPCMDSLSLVSEVADLRISESEPPLPESSAVIQDSSNRCTPEDAVAGGQHENEHSVSPLYERIINASISNFHNVTCSATRVIFVVPDSLKHEDLPQAARGLPNITLKQSEIETLTATVPGRSNERFISLMKKIFRAVIGKCQV